MVVWSHVEHWSVSGQTKTQDWGWMGVVLSSALRHWLQGF